MSRYENGTENGAKDRNIGDENALPISVARSIREDRDEVVVH